MKAMWSLLAIAGLGIVTVAAFAQPPEGPPPGRGPRGDGPGRGPGGPGGPPVVRALDTDKDGELSADEIAKAAESLKSLDQNEDGKLTEDELRPPRPDGPGPGGPGEFGPPRGEGPGGDRGPRERRRFSQDGPGPRGPRGPRGDFGPPPGPGGPPPMMPPHLREELDLSDDQVKQLDALHKETREKFEKILTAEQLEKLKEHGPPGPPHERDE